MNTNPKKTEKTILVTGSTDGIGKQTALKLAQMGYRVIIHGRTIEKAEKTAREITKLSGNNNENNKIISIAADLAVQEEIHRMVEELSDKIDKLDVLINNAGVYQTKREITPDGLEVTFAVNHMAPFILTNLLFRFLKNGAEKAINTDNENSFGARVVTVSSMIHAGNIDFGNLQGEKYFSGSYAYSLSKLCNVLFTYYYAEKVVPYGISANCLHPGVVNTKLLRKGWGGGGIPTEEGAKNSVYLATSEDVKNITGKYFMNLRPVRSTSISYDKSIQRRLWEISLKLWKHRVELPYY